MNLDKSTWRTVRLGDVATEYSVRENNPSQSSFDRFVGSANIGRWDFRVKSWESTSDVTSAMKQFSTGDYLLVRRSLYASDFRERAPRAHFDGICSGDILTIREKPEHIADGFLISILNSPGLWQYIVANGSGSITRRIKWRELANYEFLLPPLEQQAQLAELLWAADETESKQRNLLHTTKIAQKRYAIDFHEDKTQKSGTLTDLAKINPRAPKELNDPDLPVTFLAMADVSEDSKVLTKHERKLSQVRKGFTYFADGDILFAKITPCMENGKGALVENLLSGVGFGSTEFHVLRPYNEADKWYCYYVSRMEKFRLEAEKRMVGSAGQRRVQTDFFENFSLQLPTPEARIIFGETMNRYEEHIERLAAVIDQTSTVKLALINQIFTT
jgi:type I restriction enzyme, S subunit